MKNLSAKTSIRFTPRGSRELFLRLVITALFALVFLPGVQTQSIAAESGATTSNESGSFMLNPDNYGFWSNVKSPDQFKE